MNNTISIITICFNAEQYIEKTMYSVLEQTYDDLEYIIIDGASVDKTLAIIDRVKNKFIKANIKIISEPDNGIYDAMNKGIKKATGEWINIMNAGDSFTDKYVLEKIFNKNIPRNISVLYSDNYMYFENGSKILIHNKLDEPPYCFCHQAVVYRRSLHFEHGYYISLNKLIISDTLFFLRIPDKEKKKINIIIANYLAGGASGKAGYEIIKQNLCSEYIFKDNTFINMVWKYYSMRIRHILPYKLRSRIRQFLGRIEIVKK